MPNIAYVICCNDAIMRVSLGTEVEADRKKENMAENDYKKNRHAYDSWKNYRDRCFWRLLEIECS